MEAFGAPLDQVTVADFASDDLVLQIGVAPGRLDILTSIGGVDFSEAWPNRLTVEIEGLPVPVIGLWPARRYRFGRSGPSSSPHPSGRSLSVYAAPPSTASRLNSTGMYSPFPRLSRVLP